MRGLVDSSSITAVVHGTLRHVTSTDDARALARAVVEAAANGSEQEAAELLLDGLDGRAWLALDQAARAFDWRTGRAPVSGPVPSLGIARTGAELLTLIAASLHVDGRIRQRAVEALASVDAPLATSALTVRALDHVAQVRGPALEATFARLDLAHAEPILEILIAGRERDSARRMLASAIESLGRRYSVAEIAARLTVSPRRGVRRWAFTFVHREDGMTADDLAEAARSNGDQWVRASCAEWLSHTNPERLGALLDARSVEARLIAIARVPDALLTAAALDGLLVDRAARVREIARTRARCRGVDVASHYRRLAAGEPTPRELVACLDGLAWSGDVQDITLAVGALSHGAVQVRAAAISAVVARADSATAVQAIGPCLVDPSARISSVAARALARAGAAPEVAANAWASDLVSSRRAAWRLTRVSGGWNRVEADLRASCDRDASLAGLGRAGVRNWLETAAATTWEPLSDVQRERMAALLPLSGLDERRSALLAFHAGIARTGSTPDRHPADSSPDSLRRPRWWQRLTRR